MNNLSSKKALLVLGGVVLFLAFVYLVIFSSAWRQKENHLAIAKALPKVIFSSEAVRIDEQTYLAKDGLSFIKAMEGQGFAHGKQLGAGYIFEKEGKRYFSISRMYSSYFQIFTYPK